MSVRARYDLAPHRLAAGIRSGERAVLARAITLVESRKPEHRPLAEALLQAVLPLTGRADRVGITGVPGVGKSTFIEALGLKLTGAGRRVAVLAVDPSSSRTGGSILGDKTRMSGLAADPRAFIRPSPTSGALGGVARMTRETMLLCEAAGFDVVLVETVGVGQSETVVAEMVDFFLALMLPGAGDELQGIKKGLVELADMIAVNKADGDNALRAAQAVTHYRAALRIIEPRSAAWQPPVRAVSALTGDGLDELWTEVLRHREALSASGERAATRRAQQVRWFRSMLEGRLLDRLRRHPAVARLLPQLEAEVAAGSLVPSVAVERAIAAFAASETEAAADTYPQP
mgnify:CR=1 FL=1